jgi:hypothetical protein
MKIKLLSLTLLLALVSPLARASSPIVFTVTATSHSDDYGYVLGQSYTFIYTTGSSFTNNSSNYFDATTGSWSESEVGHARMYSTIGGTGLTGTYTDPAPASFIIATGSPSTSLLLSAGNTEGPGIGLLTADGQTELNNFDASVDWVNGLTLSFSGEYTDPNDYFADYFGSYDATGTVYIAPIASNILEFTISNITISAVPEPSSCAAIAGLTAFGFCALRRRARR